jgi:NAD(P)H-hydrate epimerase
MSQEEVTQEVFSKVYRRRDPDAHKYDFGHLLVIGGSKLYSGSPTLNALAAYRGGVDLITVAAPKRAADIVASFSPNLITYPLDGDCFEPKHLEDVKRLLENKTAVVIGGGMGRGEETFFAIVDLLRVLDVPTVIDADAIYAVAKASPGTVPGNADLALTPHTHEFYVLTGIKPSKNLDERVAAVRKAAADLKTTILLKGRVDIISDGKKITLNRTGSPFMTVGGTGDTLAGILGSLLAQGNNVWDSACAAAYINGRAGELAAKDLGPATLATDLINYIPEVIN